MPSSLIREFPDDLHQSFPNNAFDPQNLGFALRVHRALLRISEDLRETVILRDLEEFTYEEIAEMLALPLGTVKSRINRGRAELARLLKKETL